MNKNKAFVAILLIGVLAVMSVMYSNPLRKPTEQIEKDLKNLIPVGTSMDDVIRLIENNGKWTMRYVRETSGYVLDSTGRPSEGGNGVKVGEKSIRVALGSYGAIFTTGVSAWFGFNEENLLVGIAVRKDRDFL